MAKPLAFIGLGSNLGEPTRQLELALSRLEDFDLAVELVSSWYRTEPVGGPPQPWFVNGAAGLRFGGAPEDLLDICQSVEARAGRKRGVPNGPRTLDIDLLLFGSELRDTDALTLPHPRLRDRRFVLVPMVEIAPDAVEPISGLDVRALLARCPDRSRVVRLEAGARRRAAG